MVDGSEDFSVIGETPDVPSAEAKEAVADEISTLNFDKLNLTVEQQSAQIAVIQQNIDLKDQFSHHVRYYLWAFSAFSAAIIVIDGFHLYGFKLDKVIIITLIGSTAVSVIGMVSIVISGLFKPPSPVPPTPKT